MNNLIIIIAGDLASGKTTYGKKISNTLKIPFFSKDIIKEVLFDSLYSDNISYEDKRKLGSVSYDMFYYIIEEHMKVGTPIIAESNFVKESTPIIKSLLEKYNYKCITLRFTGDLKVLHKRFLKREYSDERHMGLSSNGKFDDFEVYRQASEKMNEFKIDDNEIVIDTTDFDKIDYDKIIEDILNKYNEV